MEPMVKKVVKAMIKTCSAPMLTDSKTDPFTMSEFDRYRAFTLTELIVVVSIVSLFALLAMTNLVGLLGRNTFKAQVHELVSTMQMAAGTAAESDRRYEVVIDLAEQSYTLRHITSPELSQDMEGEIIVQNEFNDSCWISHVMFDDGDYTNETRAWFWVGRSGWQYGGKIVLLDADGQPYSVVVNRLNRIVTLEQGDVELPMPKAEYELVF
jgi:prepilin-type N-terminal cleavage/methylation domain-containing protein